jgi:hypothetical protein
MGTVYQEARAIRSGSIAIAAGEDYLYYAQRLHRLDRILDYLDARIQREWKRRPFCMNCGSEWVPAYGYDHVCCDDGPQD